MNGKPFPSLIDVTTEELVTGLESGQFTSADLVAVWSARELSQVTVTPNKA